jgi:hypothetical protein
MIQRVGWDEFQRRFRWRQAEHVTLIGPTGVGKTTVIGEIIPRRQHVVVLGTKLHDDTMSARFPGYKRIETWPPKRTESKVLLWPMAAKSSTLEHFHSRQRVVFGHAMNAIILQRNWTVVNDEVMYLVDMLGLRTTVSMYHYHGRSSGITNVDGFQRPAWVPRIVYSSSTHNFIWKTTDAEDIRALTKMASLGLSSREILDTMAGLDHYEFIYSNTRNSRSVPLISSVNLGGR